MYLYAVYLYVLGHKYTLSYQYIHQCISLYQIYIKLIFTRYHIQH